MTNNVLELLSLRPGCFTRNAFIKHTTVSLQCVQATQPIRVDSPESRLSHITVDTHIFSVNTWLSPNFRGSVCESLLPVAQSSCVCTDPEQPDLPVP